MYIKFEDEYQLLFEWKHFIELGKQYLPTYYVKNSIVFKFVTFMIVFNSKNMTNVAIFLKHAFKEIV